MTSGTIFHSADLPPAKRFRAIYPTAADKGGISALRLSNHISVSWRTVQRILRKIRTVMAHRDSIYRPEGLTETDDACIGGKKPGKRGRGATGKTPVPVAVEKRDRQAGYMAAQTVGQISKKAVRDFCNCHFRLGREVRTDAPASLNAISEPHVHEKKVTPPEEASHRLPLVRIMTGNPKTFLSGTFHGVSPKYLREYISEFCYRFNRRFWEHELSMRLLNACLAHVPV